MMSYTVCSNCGQKALTVATRCPRCGMAFEEQFLGRAAPAPKPRRAPVALIIVGAVLTLLLGNELARRLNGPGKPPAVAARPTPSVGRPPVAAPPTEPAPVPARVLSEGLDTPPHPQPEIPAATLAPLPETTSRPAPKSLATVTGTAVDGRRYASTWINVRAERSNSAPVLRILHPGEVVRVDSLIQGWYRVVSDQQAPGYVDRRLLDSAPAPATP